MKPATDQSMNLKENEAYTSVSLQLSDNAIYSVVH